MIRVLALPAYAADERWISYDNDRFGYSVEYPDIFTDITESDSGDGVWLSFEIDKYALTLSGGNNVLEDDGESSLRNRMEYISHIVPGSAESGSDWYRVIYAIESGVDGTESWFYEYGIIDEANWASFILLYPVEEQERFAAIAANMEKTLRLPPSQASDIKELRTYDLVVNNGRVCKDGTPLDCELHKIPTGLDNGIACWAVIGMETYDTVTEEETGIWFFGTEGEFITFIPLDSENEYQDLIWSPAGDRLVLVRGSGMRPDMFLEVYAEGMEKKAEFSGLRGEMAWLEDGMRFVFTQIDDIRENSANPGVPCGWKLSAVLYDSAIEEAITLKESTDTKSYSFASVSEDGENITLYETFVQSTKDWGDVEKTREREITVPVPAAG